LNFVGNSFIPFPAVVSSFDPPPTPLITGRIIAASYDNELIRVSFGELSLSSPVASEILPVVCKVRIFALLLRHFCLSRRPPWLPINISLSLFPLSLFLPSRTLWRFPLNRSASPRLYNSPQNLLHAPLLRRFFTHKVALRKFGYYLFFFLRAPRCTLSPLWFDTFVGLSF